MAKITDLPTELLLHIFQFYLEDKNQYELIHILSRVCETWKAVGKSSALWTKFDGTVKYVKMKQLCLGGYLKLTKELKFSEIDCLKDEDAKKLFVYLQNLEVIDFSQVGNFSKNVFSILANSDAHIKEIRMGRKPCAKTKKCLTLNYLALEPFLTSKGNNLTTIKLSYCIIKNPNQVLKGIADCCPNLEHLQFTNNEIHCFNFPTKHFQSNCVKLKTLHLDYNTGIYTRQKHPSGFPNLEVFTYNSSNLMSSINDGDIECILFNSPNLKFLSLPNCSISGKVLCSLPASSVEYLFLPRSEVVNTDDLAHVLKKWSCSLKQVDISYSNKMSLNSAVLALIVPQSPIEYLDLSFTQVTTASIETILEKCKQIKMLNISGCRNLNRGLKRRYDGESDLQTLFKKIKTVAYNDSTDEET